MIFLLALLCYFQCLDGALALEQAHTIQKQTTIKPALQKKIPCTLRSLSVIAIIDPKDVCYTKYFCTYHPKEFDIWVDGTKLVPHKPQTLTITDNSITVEYTYIWDIIPLYARKNGKKARFYIPPTTDTCEIRFNSWDSPNRITISGANQHGNEVVTAYHH